MKFQTATLGLSRMGPNRELKFAMEKYWKGKIEKDEFIAKAQAVEELGWSLQLADDKIDSIPVGEHFYYDGVLSWAEWLGIVPKRFAHLDAGIDRMFAMARGVDGATALGLKKWFTTNYHYLPSEVDTKRSPANLTDYLANVKRGLKFVGADKARAVIYGPVTIIRHSTFAQTEGSIDVQRFALLAELIPIYQKLIQDLSDMGVKEIQIHEPALVFDESSKLLPLYKQAYPSILANKKSTTRIDMVTYFEDVGADNWTWLMEQSEINKVSLDFTRGDNLALLKSNGFPKEKTLGAGIIDARSPWKVDPSKILPLIEELQALGVSKDRLCIQPCASLQFVPWDLQNGEDNNLLKHQASKVLSFQQQKIDELHALATSDKKFVADTNNAWSVYKSSGTRNEEVGKAVAGLTEKDFTRGETFEVRRPKQMPELPILPTTSIGSFPQTAGIRRLRQQLKKGTMSKEEYEAAIDKEITFMIGIQEGLGLDILVHGEPERTDMVEFFAQQMNGMLFSGNGWVQSFGSRCVRPPIIWADVSLDHAMTTREFKVAQSLTKKPVKGMLTGPITILNWSFPRADISRKEQTFQIGLALRKEIAYLEEAGCRVIQVDEPALREGMPMRSARKDEYLRWAVDAFRLATAAAKSETSIHTHMCYCEFGDCMEALDEMDADVNSIENARSDDETLRQFKAIGYKKGLGPGTYDIHSPVVPTPEFIRGKMESFLENMEVSQLTINPDCGLKTRGWPETIEALRVMVEVTKEMRLEIQASA